MLQTVRLAERVICFVISLGEQNRYSVAVFRLGKGKRFGVSPVPRASLGNPNDTNRSARRKGDLLCYIPRLTEQA